MKRILSGIVLSAAVLATVAFSAGCHKKKDTIAKIYVRDSSNQPVSGCQVVLKGVSTTNPSQQAQVSLFDTTSTNSSGEAIFNLNYVYQKGQAGVAVLNIEAKKNGLTGQGIIKVEEETTSEETVFI